MDIKSAARLAGQFRNRNIRLLASLFLWTIHSAWIAKNHGGKPLLIAVKETTSRNEIMDLQDLGHHYIGISDAMP
ncbi:conserved hypothetical protein [Ricinus communis]|uniref:Uncharacterized protein n=1 Tax=Ricinus communis TaxID=3988 RepID=B9RGE7_RICCO|nr:conserved hypothetical protein [Ricinus communis]